ncbi:hypothetical protein LTR84_012232 [Exophiala bonariae]|uniref:Yippee domain-containing protein n=1 Tax=Exophiala bonariae TaxID=1690606 RepID=A0AAV9NFS3_9EURO|nr:hypothetical protein LTR84_012232 [Exophiala bonariae]
MAKSLQRTPHLKPVTVNLFCTHCDSQLGVFENEWTRLTSSYMRPARVGQHRATEIGQKTQVVPNGAVQQAAEGCTMAEVFCKKCSTPVAQYCKAAPKPEQAQLVRQYFYKLSRTYLRRSDNDLRTDPVFSSLGEPPHGSGSFSVPPRPKSLSGLRSSQAPLRNSFTPSRTLLSSQTPLRSRESSIFANLSFTEPEQPLDIKVAALSERLRHQEEKIAASDQRNKTRDAQIQALAEELASFRGDLDDLQITAGDLQAQLLTKLAEGPDQTSFDSNLKQMCTFTNNVFSFSSELENLRTENAALKAKLGVIKSPPRAIIAETESLNALGKRKRNNDFARPGHSQSNDIHTSRPPACNQDLASSRPILTPQSSIISTHSSQVSEQEYTGAALDDTAMDTEFNNQMTYDDDEGNMIDYESQDISDVLLSNPKPTTQDPGEPPLPAEGNPAAEDGSIIGQGLQRSEGTGLSHAGYIEFSDDEFADPPSGAPVTSSRISLGANDTTADTQPPEPAGTNANMESALGDEEDSAALNPETESVFKRPRRTMRSNSRRLTDYELEHNVRSLAPEPATRRRTLPRKLDLGGMENVRIATPVSLADVMNGVKKPRPDRIMQSTEKILNNELMELGLGHWIGLRDKSSNPEYKAAVDEARVRQREKKRLEILARVGITLAPDSQQPLHSSVFVDPELTQLPSPSLDAKDHSQASPTEDSILGEWDRNDATVSGETVAQIQQVPTTEATIPPETLTTIQTPPVARTSRARKSDTIETPAEDDDMGMKTRRKQRRQEEIRRRDQLAQEALAMD